MWRFFESPLLLIAHAVLRAQRMEELQELLFREPTVLILQLHPVKGLADRLVVYAHIIQL